MSLSLANTPAKLQTGEALSHSRGQAGFAVLDAIQDAKRNNSGAIVRICNAVARQNPQIPAARGMAQRFLDCRFQAPDWATIIAPAGNLGCAKVAKIATPVAVCHAHTAHSFLS